MERKIICFWMNKGSPAPRVSRLVVLLDFSLWTLQTVQNSCSQTFVLALQDGVCRVRP